MAGSFKINGQWIEWHIGEKFPDAALRERVLLMQLDGHELDAVIDALKQAGIIKTSITIEGVLDYSSSK